MKYSALASVCTNEVLLRKLPMHAAPFHAAPFHALSRTRRIDGATKSARGADDINRSMLQIVWICFLFSVPHN